MNGKLRWFVGFALSCFLITVTSIIVAFFIVYKRGAEADELSKTTSDTSIVEEQLVAGQEQQATILDSAAVSVHNTPADCWMIIDGGVYNLTGFLVRHPGGSLVMTPYCGQDASLAFITKDKKPASMHSNTAKNLLKDYFVGQLGQVIAVASKTEVTPTRLPVSSSRVPIVSIVPTIALVANSTSSTSTTTLSSSIVSTHNTSSNCWIIISGTVYNVSPFLASHPGGVNVITIYCGKDATTAFATKDQNPASGHSAYAISLLSSYIVGTLGSVVPTSTPTSATVNNTPIPTIAPPVATPTAPPVASGGYTATDVSGHNTTSNCWLIISGKVYNVTSYLVSHPGGVNVIAGYCGKEATNAFATRGGKGNNHSNYAYNLLNQYFIGSLSTGTTGPTSTPIPGAPNPTATQSPNTGATCTEGVLPQSVLNKYPGATIKKQEVGDNCSQELEVNTSNGCRHIKTNSSGTITSDSSC